MLNHEYTKDELINIYKEYFEDDYPFIDEASRPDQIGFLVTDKRYNLYLGYDEKEGSSFFFIVGPLDEEKMKLEEIEAEKLAYMLSDPWGGSKVTYENKTWSYVSDNEWRICLRGKTLDELLDYYNSIVRETAGKVLDSYPDY